MLKLRQELGAESFPQCVGVDCLDRLICDYGMFDSKIHTIDYAIRSKKPELLKYLFFKLDKAEKYALLKKTYEIKHNSMCPVIIKVVIEREPELLDYYIISIIFRYGPDEISEMLIDGGFIENISGIEKTNLISTASINGGMGPFVKLLKYWNGNPKYIFYFASMYGNCEIVKYIYNITSESAHTILLGAVCGDNWEIVQFYISLNLPMENFDRVSYSMSITLKNKVLTNLVRTKIYNIIHPDYLIVACCEKGLLEFVNLLIKDVDISRFDYLCLNVALRRGYNEIAKILLAEVPDDKEILLNILDNCWSGNKEMIDIISDRIKEC
jgi:hypothetical protein